VAGPTLGPLPRHHLPLARIPHGQHPPFLSFVLLSMLLLLFCNFFKCLSWLCCVVFANDGLFISFLSPHHAFSSPCLFFVRQNVSGLPSLLRHFAGSFGDPVCAELDAKAAAALQARPHFTYEGVVAQIASFMLRPSHALSSSLSSSLHSSPQRRSNGVDHLVETATDLRCTRLPLSPRAAGP